MDMKRKIRRALRITVITMAVLLAVLVVHIVMVTSPSASTEHASRQMSRIDFATAPDPIMQRHMDSVLRSQPGVKDTYFGAGGRILIFTFDARQNKAEGIFKLLERTEGVEASLHKVSAADAAKGCPVADVSSFTGRVFAAFSGFFR